MAFLQMKVAQINSESKDVTAWEFTYTLKGAGDGDWILIPDRISGVAVVVTFTGGASGKVQTAQGEVFEIKSGGGVIDDWEKGVVSTQETDVLVTAVAAMRIVQIGTGTMTIRMRAQ